MSNRKLILAMLACLLVLVCTACGGGKDADSGTEAIDEPDTEISEEAEAPEEEPEEEEAEEEPEENDESDADLAYYTEVNARIMKKLAEVS